MHLGANLEMIAKESKQLAVAAAGAAVDDGAAVAVVIELVCSSVPCNAEPILDLRSQDWRLPYQRRPSGPCMAARHLAMILEA